MSIITQYQFKSWGESKFLVIILPLVSILTTSSSIYILIHPLLKNKELANYNEKELAITFFLLVPSIVTMISYFLIKISHILIRIPQILKRAFHLLTKKSELRKNEYGIKKFSVKIFDLLMYCYLSVLFSYIQISTIFQILNTTLLKYNYSTKNIQYSIFFYCVVVTLNFFISIIWNLSSKKSNKNEVVIFKTMFITIFIPTIFIILINFINPPFMKLALQGIRTVIGTNDLTVRNYSIPIDSHPINDYAYSNWDMSISLDKKFYLVHGVILLSVGDRSLLCPKDVKETFEKTINSTSVDVERSTEYKEFIKSTQQCHLIVNSDLR